MAEGFNTLEELLNDPMVQLVMARDRVRPEDIRLMLEGDRRRTGEKRLVPPSHLLAACRGQGACL